MKFMLQDDMLEIRSIESKEQFSVKFYRTVQKGHVVVGNNYHWQVCYHSQGSFTLTLKRYLSQELPFATPLPFDKF